LRGELKGGVDREIERERTEGNVGAGKSAVLNSLIGHPVLPTGENGATRAPTSIDLQRDSSLSSKSIVLQIDGKSHEVSASALRQFPTR
jgi:dynamin 1/3